MCLYKWKTFFILQVGFVRMSLPYSNFKRVQTRYNVVVDGNAIAPEFTFPSSFHFSFLLLKKLTFFGIDIVKFSNRKAMGCLHR